MTAEELRKALAKLEREKDWEKTQRQEMELVLQGLRVLRGDLSTKRMFFELLEVFRAILNFEDAFLLLQSQFLNQNAFVLFSVHTPVSKLHLLK